MIAYTNNDEFKKNIQKDIKELEKLKNAYNKKIGLYNIYLETIDIFKNDNTEESSLKKDELFTKIDTFKIQIQEVENTLNLTNVLLEYNNTSDVQNIKEKLLDTYNRKYEEVKNNYINKSLYEEETTMRYIEKLLHDLNLVYEEIKREDSKGFENTSNNKKESEYIKNNDTLLISEVQNKVVLPYTGKEVYDILKENNKYDTAEEVIEKVYTRPLSDFKPSFKSRYNEAMKLAKERENFGLADSITLATEMMNKRFLHPAVIAACRTLDELDVYLDCLDKNELEDFKIFKINFESYPMVIKKSRKRKEYYM